MRKRYGKASHHRRGGSNTTIQLGFGPVWIVSFCFSILHFNIMFYKHSLAILDLQWFRSGREHGAEGRPEGRKGGNEDEETVDEIGKG